MAESIPLLVSMDPGLRVCGIGIFYTNILIHAMLVQNTVPRHVRDEAAWEGMANAVVQALQSLILPPLRLKHFVYENPQNYKGRGFKSNVKSDDLAQLRGVNDTVLKKLRAADLGRFSTTWYHPFDWKRTVDKEVMTRRIISTLTQEEKALVVPCASDLMHNVYDGVGIGLHHLGRRVI